MGQTESTNFIGYGIVFKYEKEVEFINWHKLYIQDKIVDLNDYGLVLRRASRYKKVTCEPRYGCSTGWAFVLCPESIKIDKDDNTTLHLIENGKHMLEEIKQKNLHKLKQFCKDNNIAHEPEFIEYEELKCDPDR